MTESPARRLQAGVVAAIALGGAIGTLGRYGLFVAFPTKVEQFPWTTLVINLGGSLVLGVVQHIALQIRPLSRLLRPFLVIGVLGGFTTFSTVAVEIVQRTQHHPSIAALYLAASVVGGPLAILAGGAGSRAGLSLVGARRGREPSS